MIRKEKWGTAWHRFWIENWTHRLNRSIYIYIDPKIGRIWPYGWLLLCLGSDQQISFVGGVPQSSEAGKEAGFRALKSQFNRIRRFLGGSDLYLYWFERTSRSYHLNDPKWTVANCQVAQLSCPHGLWPSQWMGDWGAGNSERCLLRWLMFVDVKIKMTTFVRTLLFSCYLARVKLEKMLLDL